MGIDQREQRLGRQRALRDGVEQRRRDRIGQDLAARLPGQRIAPPLQPDFARQRLARRFAHPRDLAGESVERIEMPPRLRRREQAGEIAVLVGRANQRLAMGIGVLHGKHRLVESAATSARRMMTVFAQRVPTAPSLTPLHLSLHRDQQRADPPPLAEQNVVGAHRGAGGHGFERDVPRAKRVAQRPPADATGSLPVPIRK